MLLLYALSIYFFQVEKLDQALAEYFGNPQAIQEEGTFLHYDLSIDQGNHCTTIFQRIFQEIMRFSSL